MGYQFHSRIRYSEVGEDKRLTLPKLVDYFQDCSAFQSARLKDGVDQLKERHRAWILAYWQIQIKRMPQLEEEVTAETWPYAFRGFYGDRNFVLKDKEGNILAQAASLWIYLDTDTGHPCKVDKDVADAYTLEEPLQMGKLIRKIQVPENGTKKEPFSVMHCHLDTNHHMNNVQYILMAEEYLPAGFKVSEVRVEYRKSALLHNVITPMVYEEEKKCTVSLNNELGQPYAVLEFSEA